MSVSSPNFLIVGSAKSGTTALYHYLNQHPQVFMSPVKEPLFFCSVGVEKAILEKELYPISLDDVISDPADYAGLFSGGGNERAFGEASVYYLLDHKKTITNIKKYVSDWKKLNIVIILRNPVDACFSHHQMYSQYLKNFLGEKDILTFEESLNAEQQRISDGYMALAHFHWFFYYQQVKDYMENFDNVRVYLQADLKNDPDKLIEDLFEFIGVEASFVPDLKGEQYNVSGAPRSNFLYKFLISEGVIRKMIRPVIRLLLSPERKQLLIQKLWSKNLKKAEMEPEMRERLVDLYHEDITSLQGLIGRDLSEWLK